jgi:hypothetical protein
MSSTSGPLDRRQLDALVGRVRSDLRGWTDSSESDPGVALLELFAYLGELLVGYSARISAEGQLGVAEGPGRAICGVHRASVVDNVDPLAQQRLLVRVPDVDADLLSWAVACLPVPTSPQVPAIGDQVWVAFEAGDPSAPVWLGQQGRPAT